MTNLVQIPVSMHDLARWSAQRGMSANKRPDIRASLHHLLDETFGQSVMKPYRIYKNPKDPSRSSIYGYSKKTRNDLVQMSNMIACPNALEVINVEDIRAKAMPANWKSGAILGFDVCTVPVRRRKGSGKEIDVHVLDLQRLQGAPDSEKPTQAESYLNWLQEKFGDAAEVIADTVAYRSTPVATKRKKTQVKVPETTFMGNMKIKDPDAFAQMLENGIGRHKSYGYGMVMLRGPNERA